jgi:hypothetical protein
MRTHLFFTFLLLLGINGAAQELVGADRTSPGTLASFEIIPAQEVSWHIVTPSSNGKPYQVDSGTSKLYFASPERGTYTVIAGITVKGKPQLLTKTFTNGEEEVQPLPIPVTSLEQWIKTQVPILVKSQNLAAESKLVADCFEQIVQRMDDGTIKTAPNARSQLQIALTGALAQASPTAMTDWTPFLEALSRQLEKEFFVKIDDLVTVRQVLQRAADAMQSLDLPSGVRRPNRVLFRPIFSR